MKKRLAVLTNRSPIPVNGGDKRRLLSILQAYITYYDVEIFVIGYDLPNDQPEFLIDDNLKCKVQFFNLSKSNLLSRMLKGILALEPLQVALYFDDRIRAVIQQELYRHDMILVHLARAVKYSRGMEQRSHVDLTDAVSLKYYRSIKARKMLPWNYLWRLYEFYTMRKLERRILHDNYKEISFISENDVHFLTEGVKNSRVSIIRNPTKLRKIVSDVSSKELLFAGRLDAEANIASLTHTRKLIRQAGIENEWTMRCCGAIGRKVPKSIKESCDTITANPSDYEQALHNAFAGVCIMVGSAGLQNKILDYVSVGLPVICSEDCARPIGLKHMHSCIVVADADDLKRGLVFLKDKENYEAIVHNSRKLIAEKFSEEAVHSQLINRIKPIEFI